jgi:pyruvate dehydrogenase E2 component (dihydrolipoamide acetyltransferase)
MLRDFSFPDVGEGIAEGEIVRWLVKEGDWIKEDQELVEVETDKAVVTINSPYTGKIEKLHSQEGQIVKVGEPLATIEGKDEAAAAVESGKHDAGTVVGSLAEEPPIEVVRPVLATPGVRAFAKQMNVDLAEVKGTGPSGRITKGDIETVAGRGGAARAGAPADAYGAVEKIPLRGIRRTVAKRMAEASKRVADVTIWQDADITELAELRAKENQSVGAPGVKLTYLPFLIKAAIAALKSHPYFNASLDEEAEEIILKKYYNVGIAVDTTEGLMVFVIKKADQKSIEDLAREGAMLAEKARLRKIDLADLKGSTFTITNYGVVGALYGTPIINHPEVAILGLGKIDDRPVVRNGQIVIRKMMPLSLAFDHRVIDGVEAGRFLGVVIRHLENPELMVSSDKTH